MYGQTVFAHIKTKTNVVSVVQSLGVHLTPKGKRYVGLCPFHEDKNPSFAIYQSKGSSTLDRCSCFPCGLDCDIIEFVSKVNGLSSRDAVQFLADRLGMSPTTTGPITHSRVVSTSSKVRASEMTTSVPANASMNIVAQYDYCDETGALLSQVVRLAPKDFRQRRPDGDKWKWGVADVRPVLFRLPAVITAARQGATVFVCEGEKDVVALEALGLIATTNAGGAGKWRSEYTQSLRGVKELIILNDNDNPGRDHAEKVAASCHDAGIRVKVIALPGLPEKGDVSDWIGAGGTREHLDALVQVAPIWAPVDSGGGGDPVAGWEQPIPLPSVNVPDFPVEALSSVLREYVKGLAIETQTPTALAAMVVLGIVATAAAKRRVEVEVRPGWCEGVNIYAMPVMDPGNRKSGVFRDSARPLVEFEANEERRLASEVKRSESRLRVAEKALENAIAKASKCDLKDKTECDRAVERLTDELEAVPRVASPRLWVDDVTQEVLTKILSQTDGRLGILSAEGGMFAAMNGRYSSNGAPSMDALLKGHAGDDIAVDRVSRPSVRIPNPALTVVITVQPAVMRSCAATPEFRGRGLMARFLYVVPESTIGRRLASPPPCPEEARHAYYAVILKTLGIEPLQGEDGGPVPHTLTLTPDGLAAFLAFVDWLEPQLGEYGGLHSIIDWGAKLAGAVARIAGLLHVVESDVSKPISVETITRAITIGRFLIPHAQAAFQMMGKDEGHENARVVLAWIRKIQQPFTKRDAFNGLRSQFASAEMLDLPLSLLVKLHHIRELPRDDLGRAGRPSSPRYEVNPATLPHNTHNTHNPAKTSMKPSFAYSAYSAATPEPETTPEPKTITARVHNPDADAPGPEQAPAPKRKVVDL